MRLDLGLVVVYIIAAIKISSLTNFFFLEVNTAHVTKNESTQFFVLKTFTGWKTYKTCNAHPRLLALMRQLSFYRNTETVFLLQFLPTALSYELQEALLSELL